MLKDGTSVKKGILSTSFRVSSIFWPPYAFIYWPMGLRGGVVYDLVNDTEKRDTTRGR